SGEQGLAEIPREAAGSVREAEARAAGEVLGVGRLDFLRLPDLGLGDAVAPAAARLREILTASPPDLIYLPHPGEAHPDHAAALPVVRAALPPGLPAELRGYEVWSPLTRYGWVEDVSAVM